MKTLSQLLELTNEAVLQNGTTFNQWFIRFSGHVNTISLTFYQTGWKSDGDYVKEECLINLNSEGSIQEGYWFIKNRLK